jgi:hypothetical protein
MPILKYLKPKSNILCPFDTKESWFVKLFEENGHNVNYSHILNKNFLDYKQEDVINIDYIISNPPYSKKTEIIQKLYELNKPFAMLMPLVSSLETKKRQECYKKGLEILIFDKRIHFSKTGHATFPTAYFCNRILPKQLIFESLEYNKHENEVYSIDGISMLQTRLF